MEAYFEAKASLFTPGRAVRGVVNADDPWGRRLLAEARIPLVPVRRDDASGGGARRRAARPSPGAAQRVTLAMTGAVNVDNALLAAEAAVALGRRPAEVAAGLAGGAPGARPAGGGRRARAGRARLHRAGGLRPHAGRRSRWCWPRRAGWPATAAGWCWCSAAAGTATGPSGRSWAAAATRRADLAVLTSDNPRAEDPDGHRRRTSWPAWCRPPRLPGRRGGWRSSRTAAGRSSWRSAAAGPGDVVVVAGKGHETVQEVGGPAACPSTTAPWSPRLEAGGRPRYRAPADGGGLSRCSPSWRPGASPSGRHPRHPGPHALAASASGSASTSARTARPATASRPARPPWAGWPSWARWWPATPSATWAPRSGSRPPATWWSSPSSSSG